MSIRATLALSPVIPVLTIEQLAHALPIARALRAGGLRVLEVTLRSSVALQAIEIMRQAVPDAVIGAGTLKCAQDFANAAQAGAQFAVSPGLTPELAEAATQHALPLLPGVMTPSELMRGLALGFDTFKLFPAQQAGGVAMLKALAAPFPEAAFCPTGGITRGSAPEFLALANVLCVGGSWIAPADAIRAGHWQALEDLARDAAALQRAGSSR